MKYILNRKKIVFLFLAPLYLMGQGDGTNLQKYWYYKTRFNNDFVSIGTSPGQSIPFNQRSLYEIALFKKTDIALAPTSSS